MENNTIEIISGRLGVDPYLAYIKKGEPVCEIISIVLFYILILI